MLSSTWAGVAARRPTTQPSARATPGAAAGGTSSATVSGGGGGGGAQAAVPMADADGFITVGGNGKARRGSQPSEPVTACGPVAAPPPNGDAGADITQSQDMGDADGAGFHDAHDGAQPNGEEEAQEATSDDLRGKLAREQRVLAFVVQQGYQEGDPVRDAAEHQVAAAKAAWEATRPGVAVTTRLMWAEKALLRARRGQAKMEQTIANLDDDYERQRGEYMAQLHQLRARTRGREEKLAEVSRQAAEEFQHPEAGGDGAQIREAVGTIDGPIRDAVLEAMQQAPEGSPLHIRLSGALGTLAELRGMVTRVARPRWADQYDMADSDDEQWWGYDDDQNADDGWQSQGGGFWDGWGRGSSWPPQVEPAGAAADGDAMDTGDVQAPPWIGSGADARHGSTWIWSDRSWKRGRWYGQDASGMQGRHNAHEDPNMEDHERAACLQAAHQDAALAATNQPAPPTPVVAENPALERRKQAIWDLAQDQEVPITSDEIARMSSGELEDWAIANLDQL